MHKTIALLFAAGALAQISSSSDNVQTITYLNEIGFTQNDDADDLWPAASIIGASAGETTYGIPYDEYGTITMVLGPSTMRYSLTDTHTDAAYTDDGPYTQDGTTDTAYTADFTLSEGCEVHGTTAAVCVISAAGAEANFPGVETSTLEGADLEFATLYVTAGFENLKAGATASAGVASETGTAVSTASSSSASSASGTALAKSGSRTSAGTSQTASSTSGSATTAAATGGAAQLAVPFVGAFGVLAVALAL